MAVPIVFLLVALCLLHCALATNSSLLNELFIEDRCLEVTHEKNATELYRKSYDEAQGCQRVNKSSLAEAKTKAWEFAPRIMFHELEEFFISSVEDYLAESTIWDVQSYSIIANATELNMLNISRDPGALNISEDAKYFVTKGTPGQDEEDLVGRFGGAPFSANGTGDKSTAPMYYTVRPGRNHTTWVYTYWAFFDYNGCSNQEALYTDGNGNQRTYNYIACDFGTHEADWEYVKVEVCQDLTTVLRVALSQHGWNDMMDCTKGQCHFHPQDASSSATHPLAFSALNSHALHRKAARTWIYKQERSTSELFNNIMAMNLVDRSLNGSKYWHPEPRNKNLVYLGSEWRWNGYKEELYKGMLHTPETVSMHYHTRRNLSRDSPSTFKEWDTTLPDGPSWVYFNGIFGYKNTIFNDFQTPEPLCLSDNQTEYLACPNNGIFTIINGLLGVKQLPYVGDSATEFINDFTAAAGLAGVGSSSIGRKSDFRLEFLNFDSPPIGKVNADKYARICPQQELFKVGYAPPTLDIRGEADTTQSFLIVMSTVFGLGIFFLMLASCYQKFKLKKRADMKRTLQRTSGPSMGTKEDADLDKEKYSSFSENMWEMWAHTPKLALIGFMLSLFGANAVLGEFTFFTRVLEKYIPSTNLEYESYRFSLQMLVVFLVVVNAVLTITSMVFCEKYYLKLFAVHYDRKRAEDVEHLDCSERCVNSCCNQDDCCRSTNRLRMMWGVQIMLTVFVFLLTLIGVIVFGVSCIIFLLDFILLFACENVANFVSGVCLDLTPIGAEVVLCGEDFAFFCNELSLMETTTMLIGCVMIVIGEFLCTIEAGFTFGMLMRKPVKFKDVYHAMLTRKITPLQRALGNRCTGGFHEIDEARPDVDAAHKYQAATPKGCPSKGLSFGGGASSKYPMHRPVPVRDNRAASNSRNVDIVPSEGLTIYEDDDSEEKETLEHVELSDITPAIHREEDDGKQKP